MADDILKRVEGGFFVAFEGCEGTGKSTQAERLAQFLGGPMAYRTVLTREPGGTRLGGQIRAILLSADSGELVPRAEALLYAADRAQHVEQVIRTGMAEGAIVVSDRYADSTAAYQGGGRRLGWFALKHVSEWAAGELVPDLTVLLDMDPVAAMDRKGADPDRIEAEPAEFHARVREGFLVLARSEPHRYVIVNAASDPDILAGYIAGEVLSRLSGRPVDMPVPDRTARFPEMS